MERLRARTLLRDAITIHTLEDIRDHVQEVREAARKAHEWIAQQSGDPIEFLKSVKFEKKGYHPVTHHPLNLIEQVNQTWTYLVALKATEILLERHSDAGGFTLAPGASVSQELDIMSIRCGLVGAETFAATSPRSNGKLVKDMGKMENRSEKYRYIFFACPQDRYKETQRHSIHEKPGIEVWSLDIAESR